mmetsp:Transcript_62927/g.73220  ORF Transcript_62927/g.73220 Transcript_62927/m.73220 type:complete len:108 (+) Transcript_62927:48-371(+)|eukprot:CAMPEP_0176412480 /NCGR_PEP_ID=MMETSP0127-20121128/4165_1 /TAXON_ID=938130 /ORGANISM="Platyophrya macrostoma, Strain WH" /LENGTH=107 /DNA_ID=CAMNT_0017792151 /DNA_START=58 /DNA_END=381 /DNA_ORIENTATION=-
MGQGASAQHTVDTIQGEQLRQYCDNKQQIVNRAFTKCVDNVDSNSQHELTSDERQCTDEYVTLYAGFLKSSFTQFMHLYEVHQRDMYEKARYEAMQAQARSDLKQGR